MPIIYNDINNFFHQTTSQNHRKNKFNILLEKNHLSKVIELQFSSIILIYGFEVKIHIGTGFFTLQQNYMNLNGVYFDPQ